MSTTALAESTRDLLARAAFSSADRPSTLAMIERARALSAQALQRSPGDREARIMGAIAIGYRAKLTRSRSDAVAARAAFEGLIAQDPNNAEANAGLGSWHLGSVSALGSFTARMVLGAQRAKGIAAFDRAVAGGGNRALFAGLAALERVKLDGPGPEVKRLATIAASSTGGNALDAVLRRDAALMLASIKAGNADAAKALAKRLLPLGRFDD